MRKFLLILALATTACTTTPHVEGLNAGDHKVISSIHAKVLENWGAMPYIDSAKKSATVKILIQPDGSIADLQIAKSSGNTNFDNGLLIAIRQAAPFKIPASKRTEPMNYELTFTK